jgi:hypothetical protein
MQFPEKKKVVLSVYLEFRTIGKVHKVADSVGQLMQLACMGYATGHSSFHEESIVSTFGFQSETIT